MDGKTLLLAALLLAMAKKKASATPAATANERCDPKHAEKGPIGKHQTPEALLARANSRRAKDWIPLLRNHGASQAEAEGIARWIGIESGGDPLAQSSIGERGLMQATRTSALKEGLFTPEEWEALISPNTSREEHARLALKQYRWHVARARRLVINPPPESDVQSWLAYAKMHHSRPCDMRHDRVHGPADKLIPDIFARYRTTHPHRIKRLHAASIVGFGQPADNILVS